jgi:hypothetical protein
VYGEGVALAFAPGAPQVLRVAPAGQLLTYGV